MSFGVPLTPSDRQRVRRAAKYADVPDNTLPMYVLLPRDGFDEGTIRWRLSGWRLERIIEDRAVVGVQWIRSWSAGQRGRTCAAAVSLRAPPLMLGLAVYGPAELEPFASHKIDGSHPFMALRGRIGVGGLINPSTQEIAAAFQWADEKLRERIGTLGVAPRGHLAPPARPLVLGKGAPRARK